MEILNTLKDGWYLILIFVLLAITYIQWSVLTGVWCLSDGTFRPFLCGFELRMEFFSGGCMVATYWTFLFSTKGGWDAESDSTLLSPSGVSCWVSRLSQTSLVLVMWCLRRQHYLQSEQFPVCFTWESRRNYALAYKCSLAFTTLPGLHQWPGRGGDWEVWADED